MERSKLCEERNSDLDKVRQDKLKQRDRQRELGELNRHKILKDHTNEQSALREERKRIGIQRRVENEEAYKAKNKLNTEVNVTADECIKTVQTDMYIYMYVYVYICIFL
eukprot:GHVQ01020157.1.p1 GENE.GHVQ01020157.1~~GHVQ01020157.1.p1  ORF type:complete len:109 (-),score=22.71 GHVQ01020157.1:22-348(-)